MNQAGVFDAGDVIMLQTSGNLHVENTSGSSTTTIDTPTTINASLTADSSHRVFDIAGTGLTSSNNTVSLNTGALSDPVFGTGHDGNLTYDGSTTILGMAPSSSVYTLTRSITGANITINNGVTIKLAGYQLVASGTLTNNGTIQANGNPGVTSTGGAAVAAGWYGIGTAGVNGGGTGAGGNTGNASAAAGAANFLTTGAAGTASNNTFGGNGGTCSGGGGGSGFGSFAGGVGGLASATVGNDTPAHLALEQGRLGPGFATTETWGASGGSGGAAVGGQGGGSGGGGGMAFVAARTITGTGTISANGGNGANGASGNSGGGGGGGGGFVAVFYSTNTGSQTITANGGTGGAMSGTGYAGGNGGACLVAKFNLSGDGT